MPKKGYQRSYNKWLAEFAIKRQVRQNCVWLKGMTLNEAMTIVQQFLEFEVCEGFLINYLWFSLCSSAPRLQLTWKMNTTILPVQNYLCDTSMLFTDISGFEHELIIVALMLDTFLFPQDQALQVGSMVAPYCRIVEGGSIVQLALMCGGGKSFLIFLLCVLLNSCAYMDKDFMRLIVAGAGVALVQGHIKALTNKDTYDKIREMGLTQFTQLIDKQIVQQVEYEPPKSNLRDLSRRYAAYSDPKKVFVVVTAAGVEGALKDIGYDNIAGVMLDETTQLLDTFEVKDTVELLADLAAYVPVLTCDARFVERAAGYFHDLERLNMLPEVNVVFGVPIDPLPHMQNDMWVDPVQLTTEIVRRQIVDDTKFLVSVDTRAGAIEMSKMLHMALRDVAGLENLVLVGVPTPQNKHPNVAQECKYWGEQGFPTIFCLVGDADKAGCEELMQDINSLYMMFSNIGGVTSYVFTTGISWVVRNRVFMVNIILGNDLISLVAYMQQGCRNRAFEGSLAKMHTAVSLKLSNASVDFLQMMMCARSDNGPISVQLEKPDVMYVKGQALPVEKSFFDVNVAVRNPNVMAAPIMQQDGDFIGQEGEKVNDDTLYHLIQRAEAVIGAIHPDGRFVRQLEGLLNANKVRAFEVPYSKGPYVGRDGDHHPALVKIARVAWKYFYLGGVDKDVETQRQAWAEGKVDFTHSASELKTAELEGTATDEMLKASQVYSLFVLLLGSHMQELFVQQQWSTLQANNVLITAELHSEEVAAMLFVFAYLHRKYFLSTDHTLCSYLFRNHPLAAGRLEFLSHLIAVNRACLDLCPKNDPIEDPTAEHWVNMDIADVTILPDYLADGTPLGSWWTTKNGQCGGSHTDLIKRLLEVGVGAAYLAHKKPEKDTLYGATLTWELDQDLPLLFMLRAQDRLISIALGVNQQPRSITANDGRNQEDYDTHANIMTPMYSLHLADKKKGKDDCRKQCKFTKQSADAGKSLLYANYGKVNTAGHVYLPCETGVDEPDFVPMTASMADRSADFYFKECIPGKMAPCTLTGYLSAKTVLVKITNQKILRRRGYLNNVKKELGANEVMFAVAVEPPQYTQCSRVYDEDQTFLLIEKTDDDFLELCFDYLKMVEIQSITQTAVVTMEGLKFENVRLQTDSFKPRVPPSVHEVEEEGYTGIKKLNEVQSDDEIVESSQRSFVPCSQLTNASYRSVCSFRSVNSQQHSQFAQEQAEILHHQEKARQKAYKQTVALNLEGELSTDSEQDDDDQSLPLESEESDGEPKSSDNDARTRALASSRRRSPRVRSFTG